MSGAPEPSGGLHRRSPKGRFAATCDPKLADSAADARSPPRPGQRDSWPSALRIDPFPLPHPMRAPCGTHSTPPAKPATQPLTKLESALKTAIAAAHNAEKFGAEIGYVVRFDSDAIKSLAITVLINMNEGSRRWAN